jgi:type II secretory pathway pseudopilin PulG
MTCKRPCSHHLVHPARGMALMMVLIVLAMLSLGAALTTQRMVDQRQREAERELLFVGEQYRAAILSYWTVKSGGRNSWPTRLQDLIEDKRFPMPVRHLRTLYRDPLAPETDWGLVTQGAAIVGVYSQAEGEPFKRAGFLLTQKGFDDARSYADWRFIAEPPPAPTPSGGASAPGTPPKPTNPKTSRP